MNERTAPPVLEELSAEECLKLISPDGVGRIGFTTPSGPVVLPVNYTMHQEAILFRTAFGGPMDEDLNSYRDRPTVSQRKTSSPPYETQRPSRGPAASGDCTSASRPCSSPAAASGIPNLPRD
jgi:hypothetical protein